MIRQCEQGHSFLDSQNPKCPWCRVAELEAALVTYGDHTLVCASHIDIDGQWPCNCGFGKLNSTL